MTVEQRTEPCYFMVKYSHTGLKQVKDEKTFFRKTHNIEEVDKKLYLMFTDQCELPLKTKLKVTKMYDRAHIEQERTKLLDIIMRYVCGVESHLQEHET